MKQKEIDLYIDFAQRVAEMSHAIRLKTGAVITRSGGLILSYGYNGMPEGMDNCCEHKIYEKEDLMTYRMNDPVFEYNWDDVILNKYPFSDEGGRYRLLTKDEVIHAEANAILKCAKEGNSTKDAWMFITHSPCIECAKMIKQSGITNVIYINEYRDPKGAQFLNENEVKCIKYDKST